VTDGIIGEASVQSRLQHIGSTFRSSVPQLEVNVDREKAQLLNVQVGDAFNTLQSYMGSTYVDQFVKFGHTFPVFVQADDRYRLTPEDLRQYEVRNASGAMVPMGAFTNVDYGTGPALISLYNLYPAAMINGMPQIGTSSGQALQIMEGI